MTASKAPATEDESPNKPTLKKADKDGVIRPNGTLKLKRPPPKQTKPGNWREGSLVDGRLLFPSQSEFAEIRGL